jgi:hypothetical protein
METRQELVLKFMLAMAGTNYYAKAMAAGFTPEMENHAKDIYLAAAILADQYLSKV